MLTDDFMRNRSSRHRHLLHVAARAIDRLAHRLRNFVCLSCREADLALPIANGDKCIEREAASTLNYLGNTVDGDHVLDELASTVAASTIAAATVTTSLAAGPA